MRSLRACKHGHVLANAINSTFLELQKNERFINKLSIRAFLNFVHMRSSKGKILHASTSTFRILFQCYRKFCFPRTKNNCYFSLCFSGVETQQVVISYFR